MHNHRADYEPAMHIKTEDMELFVAIVDTGSITRAADHLAMAKSNVSRRIRLLEESIGARLLERTTRSLTLTDTGATLYRGCVELLDRNQQLLQQLDVKQNKPAGRLSVFAPHEFLGSLFRRYSKEFARTFPDIQLDFLSGAARPHLLHDKIDVMIHLDAPEDSSYVARKLITAMTGCYASREYLDQKGRPAHPSELVDHDCIVEFSHDRQDRPWLFTIDSKVERIPIKPYYRSDSTVFVKSLASQGIGIAMLPNFACINALESGELVKVFDNSFDSPHNIYALYSSKKLLPEKISAFLNFLSAHIPETA
jgi:DNA-binding transcriptional LysR family regulator